MEPTHQPQPKGTILMAAANVTKGDLVNEISDDAGISKKAAGDALNSVIDTITKNLKKGLKLLTRACEHGSNLGCNLLKVHLANEKAQ